MDSLLSRAVRAALAVLDAGRWVGLEPASRPVGVWLWWVWLWGVANIKLGGWRVRREGP